MRFQVLDILPHLKNPVTGRLIRTDEAYGHDRPSFSVPTMIPQEQQLTMLERFAGEVVPVVRATAPTTLRSEQDPDGGGRQAVAGMEAARG